MTEENQNTDEVVTDVADAQNAEPQPASDVAVDQVSSPEPTPNAAPLEDGQSYDDEDVPEALGRETEDGPGFGDESQLPAEDFDSFAEEDVEVETP